MPVCMCGEAEENLDYVETREVCLEQGKVGFER